ncbi:MAG: two-component system nitrogen regulation sensor histidine kinase NtrY [Phenylobacterium sp.]|jgi:two-component system nitrogen regulation sensor histidine kinase NtrY
MVSNRFAVLMIIRVMVLFITLLGLSLALTADGYYGVMALLILMVVAELFELYRYISQTNAQLSRFLEAARFGVDGDSGGGSAIFTGQDTGAGFEQLGEALSDIMAHFTASRIDQQAQLRHLKSLTEHIPVPLLSIYPDGKIQLHNHAARHLFGRVSVNKTEDLRVFGETFFDTITTLEPGVRHLLNFAYDQRERQLTVVMSEIVTGTLSGNTFSAKPFREKLISLQDIQSELDSAQLQAWEDLVRVLTHEIMNSITPVASLAKTATELVDDVAVKLNTNASVDEVLEELQDVHRAVDTVARRSDGLMQFVQSYRSLTQQPVPQKQMLLVSELFQRVEKLLIGHWASKGIGLTVTVESQGLQLFADPDLVEQILINLLRNAEQALQGLSGSSGLAGTDPQVTLEARMNHSGYVLLEVADNGPGIAADIAKEIFVPFYTTKQQGSGVGLALTRQIMMAHGGSVTLSTSDAGGAKFTLIF